MSFLWNSVRGREPGHELDQRSLLPRAAASEVNAGYGSSARRLPQRRQQSLPQRERLRLQRLQRHRVRPLAGVDGDVVHVPAEDAATAVHAEIIAQPDGVAGRNASGQQVDLRLAPTAGDTTAVAAAEGALAGQRVGVALPPETKVRLGMLKVYAACGTSVKGAAVDADPEVAAVPAEFLATQWLKVNRG